MTALVAPSAVFNANTVTCYTPLFMSCFEASGQTLCTKFLEDLNIVATVNSEPGMGLSAPLTSATYRLHCFFVMLEEEDYNSYIEMQFARPITQLWYDIWTEPVLSLSATDTERSYASEFDGLVFATHFVLKDSQTSALSEIDGISIDALGLKQIETNSLLNSIDTGLLQVGDFGSDVLTYYPGAKAISYYWGLSKTRTFNTGHCSFINARPRFIVTFPATGVNTTQLHIIHERWQLVTMNPNGTIEISINR